LIREINVQLGTESIVFYPVKNISHLMVWVGGKAKIQTFPPEEIAGKVIFPYLPRGDGANILTRCMEVASQFLQEHPLNEERNAQELAPINGLWFSRPGKAMELETWKELYELRGALIAEDGMIQGIGQLAGLTPVEIFETKESSLKERCLARVKGVLKSLGTEDFVFVHLSTGENDLEDFPQTIDKNFVGPLLEHLEKSGDWKILFMESPSFIDFPRRMPYLPIDKPISYLIASPSKRIPNPVLKEAYQLMPRFIKGGALEK